MAKQREEPARGMTWIRAKIDHLTTQNTTLMAGQVGECPLDRAKVLVGRGHAEIVEGEIEVPTMGTVQAVKGDHAERATSRKVETAEHQAKKG